MSNLPTVPGIYVRRSKAFLEAMWTAVPNELVRDSQIGWDAKGAYAWLNSHMELEFKITAQSLADAGNRGRNHAYDMIRELEKCGWLTRHRVRNPATGFNDIQIYELHHTPVPVEERTWTESKAKPRIKHDFKPAEGSVTDRAGMKPERVTSSASGPVGDDPIPARSGMNPLVPDRAVSDRAGALYTEEKNKKEDQRGGYVTGVPGQRVHTLENPPPKPEPDLDNPTTWVCPYHNERPELRGAPCTECGHIKRRCKEQLHQHQLERERQRRQQERKERLAETRKREQSAQEPSPAREACVSGAWRKNRGDAS